MIALIAVALLSVPGEDLRLHGDYTLGEVCTAIETDLQITITTSEGLRNQCVYVSWQRPFSAEDVPAVLASLGLRSRPGNLDRQFIFERVLTKSESRFDSGLRAAFDQCLRKNAHLGSSYQDIVKRHNRLLEAGKALTGSRGSVESNANVRQLYEYAELRSAYFATTALSEKIRGNSKKVIADFQYPDDFALIKNDAEMIESLNPEVEAIKSGRIPTNPEFFLSFDWSGGEVDCVVRKTYPFYTSAMSRLPLPLPPVVEGTAELSAVSILSKEFPIVDSILGVKGDYSLASLPELIRLHGKNSIFWAPRRGIPFAHVSQPFKLLPNTEQMYALSAGEVLRLGVMVQLERGKTKYVFNRTWFGLSESDSGIQLIKPDEPRNGTNVPWNKLMPILRQARRERRKLSSKDMAVAMGALSPGEILACSQVGFDRPDLPEAETAFVQGIALFALVSSLEDHQGSSQGSGLQCSTLKEGEMGLLVSILRRSSNWPRKSHFWRTRIESELATGKVVVTGRDTAGAVVKRLTVVGGTGAEVDSLLYELVR